MIQVSIALSAYAKINKGAGLILPEEQLCNHKIYDIALIKGFLNIYSKLVNSLENKELQFVKKYKELISRKNFYVPNAVGGTDNMGVVLYKYTYILSIELNSKDIINRKEVIDTYNELVKYTTSNFNIDSFSITHMNQGKLEDSYGTLIVAPHMRKLKIPERNTNTLIGLENVLNQIVFHCNTLNFNYKDILGLNDESILFDHINKLINEKILVLNIQKDFDQISFLESGFSDLLSLFMYINGLIINPYFAIEKIDEMCNEFVSVFESNPVNIFAKNEAFKAFLESDIFLKSTPQRYMEREISSFNLLTPEEQMRFKMRPIIVNISTI